MGKISQEGHKLEQVWARKMHPEAATSASTSTSTSPISPNDAIKRKHEAHEKHDDIEEHHDGDDEEWASEDEEHDHPAGETSSSPKPASLSPARRAPTPARRRSSVSKSGAAFAQTRRNLQNQAHRRIITDLPLTSMTPRQSQTRGRTPESPINPRLGALRSRDSSPTRSIRFADQMEEGETPRSGYATPRGSILHDSHPEAGLD